MAGTGADMPTRDDDGEPRRRRWRLDPWFWDLRASHWVTIFLTICLLFVGIAQFMTYRQQAAIMSRQLTEMQSEQRPWIYADFSPGDKLSWSPSGGLSIPITFIFHNTGHLPAHFVSPVFETHTWRQLLESGGLRSNQQRTCQDGMNRFESIKQRGGTVFPGQNQPFHIEADIPKDEWTRYQADGVGQPILVYGCFVYKRGYGVPLGATGFAVTIVRVKDQSPAIDAALPSDPTHIPAAELRITQWPEGSAWQLSEIDLSAAD